MSAKELILILLYGKFILFQYTRLKQQFFQSFFVNIEIERVLWNISPAFVFTRGE